MNPVELFAFIGLIVATPAAAERDGLPSWGSFSRAPASKHEVDDVLIGTLASGRRDGKLDYWMRRTHRAARGAPAVTWADSRTCPAMTDAIAQLRDVTAPRLDPPGFDRDIVVTADGVGYSITAPTQYNEPITLASNTGTPIAAWVDATLMALHRCWHPDRPPELR